jgi:DNA-directed RNA polymerase subunit RPC12/RpoP
MVVQERASIAGEVHCLNCGRDLATVIRDNIRGRLQLQPPTPQGAVQVTVAGRHTLRCSRCGGRAFVQWQEDQPPRYRAAAQTAGSRN